MNKLLILSLVSVSLLGCSTKEDVVLAEYDYSDVADQIICWKDVLSQHQDQYYAYIFSKTCGHCNEIKQTVITYALEHTDSFYFVEFNSQIPIINDASTTIGKSSIDEIGIVGTPTLFAINNGVLMENIPGTNRIVETLTNDY